jgi:hypothetical protein
MPRRYDGGGTKSIAGMRGAREMHDGPLVCYGRRMRIDVVSHGR